MKPIVTIGTILVGLSLCVPALTALATGESDQVTTHGKVSFEKGGGEEPPIIVDPEGNPESPAEPVEPGAEPGGSGGGTGPLQIVFAPNLDFGTHKVSSMDQTYTAALQTVTTTGESSESQKRANYVQVADLTGEQAGWQLKVTQLSQFTDGTDDLEGAKITFANGVVKEKANGKQAETGFAGELTLVPGDSALMMVAEPGKGMGNNSLSFGNASENEQLAEESITLFVPESAIQKANTTYTTELDWQLSQGPANKEA